MPLNDEELTKQFIQMQKTISDVAADVKHIQRDLTDYSDTSKNVGLLMGTVDSLSKSIEKMATQMQQDISDLRKSTSESIKRVNERVGALEKEPGNKWKTTVTQITGLVIAAIVGAVILKFTGGG
jgi:hypothetical protein